MDDKLYLRQGSSQDGPFSLVLTPERAGWTYSGLKVLTLPAGGTHTWLTGDDEILVLPLAGSAVVSCEGQTFALQGRRSVFSRVSDFSYAPRDAEVTVASKDGGVFAVPSARCANRLEPRYGPAEDVPVELRGPARPAGRSITSAHPGRSSATSSSRSRCSRRAGTGPPTRRTSTTRRAQDEAELEEIYYFETPGLAYQRVYGTPGRPIDVLAEVATGDVVLIPHGWHGPSIAAPGYDLYYLNVMAGPEAMRAWRFCDDPAHAWIRGTWADQQIDPRLPMSSAKEKER